MRRRQAWEIKIKGYENSPTIYFAPTATKAKGEFIVQTSDIAPVSFKDILSCKRAYNHDVLLPERHPIADQLNNNEIDILLHCNGASRQMYNPEKAGYRNYFVTDKNNVFVKHLVELGLMYASSKKQSLLMDGNIVFHSTKLGIEVAESLYPLYNSRMNTKNSQKNIKTENVSEETSEPVP